MKPKISKYIIFLTLSLIFVALVVYLNLSLPVCDNYLHIFNGETKSKQVLTGLIITLYYLMPFLVVIYFSEKYYLNPTQNRRLLLKLPLIAILTSVISFFLSVYALDGGADPEMFFLTFLISELYNGAILAIFAFIVASIILYSYKNNKVHQFIETLFRRSNVIMVLLLILATLYIFALVIDTSSCGVYGIQTSYAVNCKDGCLARKAFEQNDPLMCKKLWDPSMCFAKLAVIAKDKNICKRINDSTSFVTKDHCYEIYIRETGDDSACSLIDQRLKENWGLIPRYCDK